MLPRIETLPNEILLHILCYLSWVDILTSFWSLNIRWNSLICSILSINNNRLNSGLVFTRGLSYTKCSTLLLPLISNSVSLSSAIRRIHFDGGNSNTYDFCYEWLFTAEKVLRFPNVKSLVLTRCRSVISIFQSLPYLVKHQLDELTLTFDDQMFIQILYVRAQPLLRADIGKQFHMLKELVCQLFSNQCHLKSLHLDISNELKNFIIHQCFASNSSRSIEYNHSSSCETLCRLHIRIDQADFFESLIERVPNIEEMSVECHSSLNFHALEKLNVEILTKSNDNWFHKMPKLRYFSLKTFIFTDQGFVNLKWLVNNLNYVEKLQLHLKSNRRTENSYQNLWKSLIDANFIRQYCLPDVLPNLTEFDFYICSQCQLSSHDIEQITASFKSHPLFIEYQWTNVKCLFDPVMSCQHLFSNRQCNYPFIFNWSYIDSHQFHPHPSLHLFLERFEELSPDISSIKIYKQYYGDWNESDLLMSSKNLFQLRQYNEFPFHFRNVTKIQFGIHFNQRKAVSIMPIDRNPIREKVLAHLISMTVQLKYLVVEQFEWLLHVVKYAGNELRTNALNTVQYAEFCLPYCFIGYKANNIGKQFVPFLSTYMPLLQTLRLWRSDDFAWSSTRRSYRPGYAYIPPPQRINEQLRSSETCESLVKHVSIFEHDLCQLMEALKDLSFLDMYGAISYDRVKAYRLMAQTRFPRSYICVEMSRFSLWL